MLMKIIHTAALALIAGLLLPRPLRGQPNHGASPEATTAYQAEWARLPRNPDPLNYLERNRPTQEHKRVLGYSLNIDSNGEMVWHVVVLGLRHVSPKYEATIRAEFAKFATKRVVIDYSNALPTAGAEMGSLH
jgi:hypothetical protein